MLAAQITTPCMEFASNCRLDWAAIDAVGGWVAAVVTFFAVLFPILQLKKDAKLRRKAELLDADIALRKSIQSLGYIYAGLQSISQKMKSDSTLDSAISTLSVVEKFISPSPLPVLPNALALRDIRVAFANLDASLTLLISYVRNYEEGNFGDELLVQYEATLAHAISHFTDVTVQFDKVLPGLDVHKQYAISP